MKLAASAHDNARPKDRTQRVSATNSQSLDQRLVTRLVGTGEIVEQLATLRYELEQSTPGVVVLDVAAAVLGEIVDAFRKDRYLHFRRSRVAGLGRIGLDDFRLTCGGNRHRVSFCCRCCEVRPGRDVVQRGRCQMRGAWAPRPGEI